MPLMGNFRMKAALYGKKQMYLYMYIYILDVYENMIYMAMYCKAEKLITYICEFAKHLKMVDWILMGGWA